VVALQIGDIAHSLRSALDVILCDIALVRQVGLSDMVYPFASDETRFQEMLAASNSKQPFKKLGADIINIIVDSRPYKGGNLLLRGLHDLNNQDKHRMAVPYVSFVSATSNLASSLSRSELNSMMFGGVPVGINVGEDIRIDESYIKHPSEQYTFNDTPVVVCLPPNFVLTGNVISVMGRLIDEVDAILQNLQATACS
jgi:hypothetical protein